MLFQNNKKFLRVADLKLTDFIKLTLTPKLRLIHNQINIIMTYTYRDDQENLNDIFFIFISCCDDEIF